MKRIAIVLAMILSLVPFAPSSAASLSALTLSSTTISGGVTLKGTVRLASAAPSSGHSIALSSSSTSAATVPSSVTIASGKTSATFYITTFQASANKTTNISASLSGVTKTAKLTVTPTKLSSISVSPTTIVNDRTGTATVKLSGPAPTGGAVVTLSASNANASVPSSLTISAGATSKTFTVTAGKPAVSTSVTITASFGGTSKTTTVKIAPLALSSMSITSSVVGGVSATGKVTINGAAPTGGAVVSLSSANAAGTVPATVTVKAGATSASFTMITKQVTVLTSVVVTASLNGISKTATTSVKPTTITSLVITPSSVTGGGSATAKITLSGPAPADGATIALSTNNLTVIGIPATATAAAGSKTVSFTIVTNYVDITAVTSITAAYQGSTKTANLSALPVALSKITLSPSSTVGGQSQVTGFVTLTGPAPEGGIVVNLATNSAAATTDETVTVAAGSSIASFGLTTIPVDSPTPVSISGTYAGATKSVTLTVNPLIISSLITSTITGGSSTKMILALNGVAPVGGSTITFTNTHPAVAQVPESVTIPAGKKTIEVPVKTSVVTSDTTVQVVATLGPNSKSVSFVVQIGKLYSIGLNSGIAIGGTSANATVVLTGPAPAGGTVVTIALDNAIAQAPSTVTVPEGVKQVNFKVTTTPTLSRKTVTITGTSGTKSTTAKLTVNPPGLRDIIPNPISVVAGGTTSATIRLTGPAPDGGATIALASSLIAYITLPATVTVPTGARSVQVVVTADSSAPIGTVATFSASMLGTSKTAKVQVTPLQLSSFKLSSSSVVGGTTVTGTLTISGPAPADGAAIALETIDGAVTVPVVVSVTKGKTTVSFSIITGAVTSIKTVTIYATFNSNTVTADLQLTPLRPSTLTISPSAIEGGETATGTITLNGKVPSGFGGVTITLSSNNASATVAASIVVPDGATSVTFPITGVPVSTSKSATISASYNGGTVTATLTINPPSIASVTLDSTTAIGGQTRTGTVSLTSPAPSGGWMVSLGSDNGAATAPSSTTVDAGATSKTFSISTTPVATEQLATISASDAVSSASKTLTVTPPNLVNFTLDKSTLLGGNANATGTVTLDGAAPIDGWTIALSSSASNAATVPATVTVPAGLTSTTFTVTSLVISVTTVATINATKGTASFNQSLTVLTLTVTSVTLAQSTLIGGANTLATVTLNTGAPAGGASITLASNNGAATTPATLSFAAGSSSQSFSVSTIAVATDVVARITATFGLTSSFSDLSVKAARPTSLSISPESVIGSAANATGTVTINGVAPEAGLTIALSKSGTGATVPATVVIAAGQTTGTFTVTSSLVSATQTVNVTATYLGTSQSGSVSIEPLVVSSLSLAPSEVIGSNSNSTATVAINTAAPAGGIVVNLTSSDTNAATVDSTVTVPQGATSATFTVTSKLVSTSPNVTITSSFNGSSKTAMLTVNPIVVSSVSLDPSAVLGGSGNSTGTVTLNANAPTGGATVTLTSSNAGAATVPATVLVPAGASSATFTVTSLVVSTATNVTIGGAFNASSASGTLMVNPFAVNSVTLSPSSVIGGFGNSTGTVTIGSAAPAGGLVVNLSSNNTGGATVPATVTVTEGATSATFTVTSQVVTSVVSPTISAASGGASASAVLTVNPVTVSTVTLGQSTIVGGTGSVSGTVTLNMAAPSGGVTVSLSSSTTSAATVPGSVNIASGATSANFTVSTLGVSSPTTVTITATYQGSKTATLTVDPASINALSVSPSSVYGKIGSSTGTVTLGQPAPAGGAIVTLTSGNTNAATVPSSVTVAAGQTVATFPIATLLVPTATNLTITATYNGSKTASFTVHPIVINSVSLSPSSVTGTVANSNGTVTLNTAAPAGGLVVGLASSNTEVATVPSTVTVPAGSTTANFTITSKAVSSSTNVTITGTFNGTKTATLTVTPFLVNSVSISPSSLTGGSTNATGTVTLNVAAPSGGATVALASSTSAATVPSTVTVPSGSTTANFTITTTAVAAQTVATITATLNSSATANLTINPPALIDSDIDDNSLTGTEDNYYSVELSIAAPAGGISIPLTSSNSSVASVPATVTVAAGETVGWVTVTTFAVASNTDVTISATFNGSTESNTFTVRRPVLTDLDVNPDTFKGGTSATGTVTLSGPAPAGGMSVTISENSSKTSVTPTTVTVAAGATTGTFTVKSTSVTGNTYVTVSGSLNGVTKTDDIKLTKN